MTPVIVTGHGEFASALEKTMEYVIGPQENVYFINFNNGMGNLELEERIRKVVLESGSDEIIFLADISGGTPFSTAVLISQDFPKSRVLGGCNMPMLFAALEMREDGAPSEIAVNILEDAKENIILFGNLENNCEIDDSEDGI